MGPRPKTIVAQLRPRWDELDDREKAMITIFTAALIDPATADDLGLSAIHDARSPMS
jgi:hypothetical protein